MSGEIDCFVAGVGSGGTLQGVGKFLKEHKPDVKIVAVEPKNVSALLGHEPGLHQIQGIGDGFVPAVLDVSLVDEVIEVTDEDAIETTRQLGRDSGPAGGHLLGRQRLGRPAAGPNDRRATSPPSCPTAPSATSAPRCSEDAPRRKLKTATCSAGGAADTVQRPLCLASHAVVLVGQQLRQGGNRPDRPVAVQPQRPGRVPPLDGVACVQSPDESVDQGILSVDHARAPRSGSAPKAFRWASRSRSPTSSLALYRSACGFPCI